MIFLLCNHQQNDDYLVIIKSSISVVWFMFLLDLINAFSTVKSNLFFILLYLHFSLLITLQIFRKQVNPEVVVSSLLSIFQRADLSKDGKWYVSVFFFRLLCLCINEIQK